MSLNLPADLVKDGVTRTASTPTEYWDLHYRGFTVVDGPALASVSYEDLTPGQKAARTRAESKARDEQKPDVNPDAQAGNANEPVNP